MNKNVIIVLLIIAFFGTIGVTAYMFGKQSTPSGPTQINANPVTIIPTITSASQNGTLEPQIAQNTGIIEGSLSFPAEVIPVDMKVCAQSQTTNQTYCTTTHISDPKFTYGIGYQLEVPAGQYYVYATVSAFGDYKAFYNEFVVCGLSVDCTDTTVIAVNATAGQTITGVDPQDWYHYQPQL